MLKYEIPLSLNDEINALEESISQYRKGYLNPVKFKGIRVPFGIYEQRKDDTYMVRIRCAAGIITTVQLIRAAELSRLYGAGALHVTTRQALQIHNVRLEDTVKVIKGLFDVGLSTRGGGGNTVRSIIASVDSGIDPDEPFDVAPYAVGLTSALVEEPDSWNLPRKYKIAFSNTHKDTAHAAFADLGFIAALKDGRKGFRVYVAGGLGSKPQTGHLLYDFILPEKVYPVAEGLKLMFGKYGNRKNRHIARLRFLMEKLGTAEFVRLLEKEIAEAEQAGRTLVILEEKNKCFHNPDISVKKVETRDFDLWKNRYVREQKQKGFYAVKVPLRLGDIKNEDALRLGGFLCHFGEDVLRFSASQNIHIRNINEDYLGNLYELISRMETYSNFSEVIGDIVSCTGADTCKLGITFSRGAAEAITRKLIKSKIDLDMLSGLRIHISGCPNTCGRHMTADLGFFGKVSRKEGRTYPAYNVVAGSIAGNENMRLAAHLGEVSARDLPDLVHDVLQIYISLKGKFRSFAEFVNSEGAEAIKNACRKFKDMPVFEEDRNYYYDWGAQDVFSLAGRGTGECSAGILDMIDFDEGLIKDNMKKLESAVNRKDEADALYQITLASSRMLLVTKGVDAKTDKEVFDAFAEHFINNGHVPAGFLGLLDIAKSDDKEKLISARQEVLDLSEKVRNLYRIMDDAFNFPAKDKDDSKGTASSRTALNADKADKFKDYRGVACPMNFVKIKNDLAGMNSGETLEVLLDNGPPIENVPASVEEQGNQVVERKKIENYWSVLIRKT